jgi:hypothetical protein
MKRIVFSHRHIFVWMRTKKNSDLELATAKQLLAEFQEAGAAPAGPTNDALWQAKKLVNAAVHPSSGDTLHPLVRMAGFVPINLPIVAGMLMSTSVPATLFFQFTNQTYGSALNYANRAGGAEVSTSDLATNYALAVGSACGLAYGLGHWVKVGPPLVRHLGTKPWAVPYASVALAGAANIYFSRRNELATGVPVCLADGTEVGLSQAAAQQGVLQTVASRGLLLPLPLLVLPPLLVAGASRLPGLGSPRLKVPLELVAITACLFVALPGCIAAFPQKLELAVTSLEPRFRALKDPKTGQPVTTLFSNKGL